jgi:hypothetical protein
LRLGNFLSGSDFDKTSTDFSINKVLQLFGIYQITYNLTMEAYKQSDDRLSEDAYFESKIPDWDKYGIFLSIMPSIENKVEMLVNRLNHLFPNEHQGKPLDDHTANDVESAKLIVARNIAKLVTEKKENDSFKECLQKLRTHSPWRTLQSVHSYWVAGQLAIDNQISLKIRQLAATRMRELANSPQEKMGAICIELHHLLNNDDRKYRDKNAKKKVEALLDEAKANPTLDTWSPMILQFEAKHHLAFNDFENARRLLRKR